MISKRIQYEARRQSKYYNQPKRRIIIRKAGVMQIMNEGNKGKDVAAGAALKDNLRYKVKGNNRWSGLKETVAAATMLSGPKETVATAAMLKNTPLIKLFKDKSCCRDVLRGKENSYLL